MLPLEGLCHNINTIPEDFYFSPSVVFFMYVPAEGFNLRYNPSGGGNIQRCCGLYMRKPPSLEDHVSVWDPT